MAIPGGRLLVLDGLHPGGRLRQLAPQKPGAFWRPDLSFDAGRARFQLESVHGGETPETVAAATGFGFDHAPRVGEIPAPAPERLKRLRRDIASQIAEFYPRFAARVWGLAA